MRIGCLQFSPIRGDFNATIKKVEHLLSIKKGPISLLIMPEMSFPGYTFTKNEILDLIESKIQEKTIDWGIAFAKREKSFIQIGYPRVKDKDIFNSVSLISPLGNIVYTYDKHFLFTADEAWASAGEGFKTFDCHPFGTIGPGICMDVNPFKFQASFDAFEFANFHARQGTRFVLLSMAWLQSPNHTPKSLIYYWIQRLEPLVNESKKNPIIVVICNRNGTEGDSIYGGSSCVLRFSEGRITLMDHLNTDDEMLLTVDLDHFSGI
jgi:protein N-terminal amidase